MQIYQPAEDSYLMSETLKKYLINLIKKNNKYGNDNQQDNKVEKNRSHINHQKPQLNNLNINDKTNIKEIKILDMGSGSGIQAETCKESGLNNILTADINQDAVKFLKSKGFNAIKSNLFSNLYKKNKFDIIIFNPPYLPESRYDKEKDTTAGKKGYEIIIKFLKQAKSHLEKDGKIFLLVSSLSKSSIIKKQAKKFGYQIKLLNQTNLFFEKLLVYELTLGSFVI